MILQGKSKVPVREVVLHCAATATGYWEGKTAFEVFLEVNKWHHARGFTRGFGYHGIVMPDGQFYSGRPLDTIGAHVMGHNLGTWGLLLLEHTQIKRIGEFEDYFTPAQRRMVQSWCRQWPQLDRVSGHNDHANRLCPGFKVQSNDWL